MCIAGMGSQHDDSDDVWGDDSEEGPSPSGPQELAREWEARHQQYYNVREHLVLCMHVESASMGAARMFQSMHTIHATPFADHCRRAFARAWTRAKALRCSRASMQVNPGSLALAAAPRCQYSCAPLPCMRIAAHAHRRSMGIATPPPCRLPARRQRWL